MGEFFSYSADPWQPATSDDDFRIRLIELQPSGDELRTAPLKCRVFWAPLAVRPSFKALSYTWGIDPPSSKIDIQGKYLSITPSLEMALQHIRHVSDSIVIWVDQISINQCDDDEKNEQVANMNRTYRAASEVIVWLGPAADGSDEFMEVWSQIGQMALDFDLSSYINQERLPLLGRIVSNVDPQDPATIEFQSMVDRIAQLLSEEILKSMVAWEQRPWFTRVWVVQEFALAETAVFMCGDKTITSARATLARLVFDDAKERVSMELRPLCLPLYDDPMHVFFATQWARKQFDAGADAGHPLYHLLKILYNNNSNMQATNACDKIYAVLGLAVDAKDLGLRADYALKDRVDLIFARTTKALIAGGYAEVLTMSQHPKLRKDLPSWVSDWTNRLQVSFADQPMADSYRLFNSARGQKAELLDVPDELVLGMTGYIVDEVETVGEVWDGSEGYHEPENNSGAAIRLSVQLKHTLADGEEIGDNITPQVALTGVPYAYEGYAKYIAQIEAFCELSAQKNRPIYPTHERRAEAIWRIPVGDIELSRTYDKVRTSASSAKAYTLCKRNFDFLARYRSLNMKELRAGVSEWEAGEATRLPERYRQRIRFMKSKRPFLTREGYLGMGPVIMKKGDVVVVLGGATLPYVVRLIDGENKRYLFLGECYCDGVMDGEICGTRGKEQFFFV